MNNAINYLQNIYETFITRDFCYIAGGSIQIIFLKYIYDGKVFELINYVSHDIFKFLIFILLSYLIGVIIQEGLSFIGIVKTKYDFPEGFNNHLEIMDFLRLKYHHITVREVERVIFLKHFGACVGGSLLLGIVFWIISIFIFNRDFSKNNVIYLIFLILSTIVSIKENWGKSRLQSEIVKSLIEKKRKK